MICEWLNELGVMKVIISDEHCDIDNISRFIARNLFYEGIKFWQYKISLITILMSLLFQMKYTWPDFGGLYADKSPLLLQL